MLIVKIGGGEAINLAGVVADLKELIDSTSEQVIVVHGANALRDDLAIRLSIPRETVTSVSGYQSVLSDEQTIDLQMLAYAGLRNKRLVEMCQSAGVNAIGLSGLDGGLIKGKRNNGIRVKDGEKVRLIRDFSGKPKEINTELLMSLLNSGYVPFLCVPIMDENGIAINSENDDIVALLTSAVSADRVVQLIEAPGFLENADDLGSVVKEMTSVELAAREGQTRGRMKRKMLALRKLFADANPTVFISDGRVDNPVRDALAGAGTTLSYARAAEAEVAHVS